MGAEEIEKLKEKLNGIDNVLLAYLFGSQVEVPSWRESDVDVAVLLKDNSWEKLSYLMEEIAETLGTSTDKVDLVDLSRADDVLKYKVIKKGTKLVDKSLYEQRLWEEVQSKLPDVFEFMDTYLEESLNPMEKEVLTRKLMALDEELNVLKTHILSKTALQVAEDPIAKRVLRDSLRVAIESMIDACKHIVASMRLGMVREYKDFPLKLGEAELIPKGLAEKLADYAKLRNVVIHRYVDLDYRLLYDKAKELAVSVASEFRERLVKLVEIVK